MKQSTEHNFEVQNMEKHAVFLTLRFKTVASSWVIWDVGLSRVSSVIAIGFSADTPEAECVRHVLGRSSADACGW